MLITPPWRPGIYTAVGAAQLPSWFLRQLCPALGNGTRIFWIDAGNSFDAYGVSRAAQALGLDSKTVLSRISLARPFNAFQLRTMIQDKLPACWRGEPVVLSDPLAPLYDEDLPLKDAQKIFAGIMAGLRRLPATWLILAVARRAPEGREGIIKELLKQSDKTALLAPEGEALALRTL